MTASVVDVSYQFVYDLYYRVRHACLESETYRLEFLEWVKAGVAYNTCGVKDPTRKISYFGNLYRQLKLGVQTVPHADLQEAVVKYYEDLFQLYQDHLEAQLKKAGRQKNLDFLEPANLVLLPSFTSVPEISNMLEVVSVQLDTYECKDIVAFRQKMSTIYASEGTPLFRCMSMLFDYGVCRSGDGVILEVR